MSKKPTTLFKYHSINNNLFKLLKSNALWFSSRRELNDLFEGRFNIADDSMSEAIEEATDIFFEEMKSQLPLFYQIDSKRFFQILYKTLKSKNLVDELFNSNFFYSETKIEWFVCCFSTNLDNNAMWAHYADSHEGVCIEFDFSNDDDLLDKMYQVTYDDEIPIVRTSDDLKTALLMKKKIWEYEDEWRILSNTGGSKPFKKESIKTIYFGNKTRKDDVKLVMDLCKEYNYIDVEYRRNYGRPFNKLKFRKEKL